jgi:hypothetical protein
MIDCDIRRVSAVSLVLMVQGSINFIGMWCWLSSDWVENTRLFYFLREKTKKKTNLDGFVGDFPGEPVYFHYE